LERKGICPSPDLYFASNKLTTEVGLTSWMPILAGGDVIVGKIADFDSAARTYLLLGGVKSVLRVPIFAEGEWCGFIAFDYCRAERDWLLAEIEIVKILAELVGSAIVSMRRLQVLAIANRIVETSPTTSPLPLGT
jgi:hypothetical protein